VNLWVKKPKKAKKRRKRLPRQNQKSLMCVNFVKKKRFMFSNNYKSNIVVKTVLLVIIMINFSYIVNSHGVEDSNKDELDNIDKIVKVNSLKFVIIASLTSGIIVIISIFLKEKTEKLKIVLIAGILIPIILTTVYLATTTIYVNLISETKGPVHWHADYELWACDNKIELIKPKGLSNKIGNTVFHDHGDNRIHVEGVVIDKKDVDLHNFFEVVGGYLDRDKMTIPIDQGIVNLKNGDICNNIEGKIQVFVYSIINPYDNKNWKFKQRKVDNFENYILSPFSSILPGDCIIIEFGQEKEQTEHICETYKIAVQRGDVVGS